MEPSPGRRRRTSRRGSHPSSVRSAGVHSSRRLGPGAVRARVHGQGQGRDRGEGHHGGVDAAVRGHVRASVVGDVGARVVHGGCHVAAAPVQAQGGVQL